MNQARKGQTAIYHTHKWIARRVYTFLFRLLLLLLAIHIHNVPYMPLNLTNWPFNIFCKSKKVGKKSDSDHWRWQAPDYFLRVTLGHSKIRNTGRSNRRRLAREGNKSPVRWSDELRSGNTRTGYWQKGPGADCDRRARVAEGSYLSNLSLDHLPSLFTNRAEAGRSLCAAPCQASTVI